MKKLSKAQKFILNEHFVELEKTHKELVKRIVEHNEADPDEQGDLFKDVEAYAAEYQTALDAVEEWREEMHSEMEAYFDERSEAWQEGDAGQAYQAWLDAWDEPFETAIDVGQFLVDFEDGAKYMIEDVEEKACNALRELPEEP